MTDNIEWLLSRRDIFAEERDRLNKMVDQRADELKAGTRKLEEVNTLNAVDQVEAARLDKLSTAYFNAAEEIRRARLRIATFADVLKRHAITPPPIVDPVPEGRTI